MGAAEPAVHEVRGGLWSLPVPIPDNPLGYTLVYLFDTDRGHVLVDTGWDADIAMEALATGVEAAGFDLADTYGVLVTHHHPDHHGLSGRVRETSGAWIAMHPVEAEIVSRNRESDEWLLQTGAALLAAGAGEDDLARIPSREQLMAFSLAAPAAPNRLLTDGDRADVPGWRVHALATPGHTPGHLCFTVDVGDERLLLAGDHLLPRITPNVGVWTDDDPTDPLGDFLASLQRLRVLAIAEVLPAHERRFTAIDDRIATILAHHEERLEDVLATLQPGPRTIWQIAANLPWSRPWEQIAPFMKRAGLAEALAHVRLLERRGLVEADPAAAPPTFRLTDGTGRGPHPVVAAPAAT